jgi:peptide/nickel transport system substrate-binding protein
VSDVPAISAIAPVMAQQLRAAGFTVQLQSMDFMSMLSRRANQGPVDAGGWSIFVTSWHNSEIQDPLRNYMIEASGKTGYAGWGDVPAIAKLTRDFLTAPGQAQRKAIAADIQKVVYDEGIYAPLGSWGRIAGTRKTITGLMEAPANVFWNIQKEGK